jgi:hypothetical protein
MPSQQSATGFSHYFATDSDVHDYNTRLKQDIHISHSKLSSDQLMKDVRKLKLELSGTILPQYLKENICIYLFKN